MVVFLRQRASTRADLSSRLLALVALLSAARKAHRIVTGGVPDLGTLRKASWMPSVKTLEDVFSLIDDTADNAVFLTLLIPNRVVATYLRRRFSRLADLGLLLSSLTRLLLIRGTRATLWTRGRTAYAALQADKPSNAPEASARRKLRRAELIAIRSRLRWLRLERVQVVCDLVFASWDVFQVTVGGEVVRACSGLLSAGIGLAQLADDIKHPLSSEEQV